MKPQLKSRIELMKKRHEIRVEALHKSMLDIERELAREDKLLDLATKALDTDQAGEYIAEIAKHGYYRSINWNQINHHQI